MSRAPATRAVLGTLASIADALASADVSLDDLYAVGQALQDASNAVLCVALDAVALDEGYRIATEYHRRASSSQCEGGPRT